VRTLTGHAKPVDLVAFSPDGKRVVSSSTKDQLVKIWRSETGDQVCNLV
jgi:WD40 repeat protein